MPPPRPIKTLYSLCIDDVLKVIHMYVVNHQKNFVPLRKYLIGLLHGGIREHLIDRAVTNYSSKVFDLLDILELLADSTTKKLQLKKNGEFLTGFQSAQLYSRIEGSNIIGLHELHVKVQIEHSLPSQVESLPSNHLHSALRRGLASNLRILTLHNAADNQSLKIIGQYAEHLTNLDITSSWLVDDFGIGELLLKNAVNVINAHLVELESCEPNAIEAMAVLPKSRLNKTCETLQEVKIQDTNTTSVSVMLLLMFCSNLKSHGGFLYYRNIGDAVLSVQNRESAPAHLQLTELWDTQLPPDKLAKICKFLPKLNSLYTRASWLPQTPGILPPLTNLTADFDFGFYAPVLFPYLHHSGHSLRRLILIDQVYSIDISQIAALCPNLEELTAKLSIHEERENSAELKNLRCAKVRITTPSTFTWIMKHSPNILQLEILLERDDTFDMFENDVILDVIEENPKSLQSIKHLSIHMFHNSGHHGYVISLGTLTIEAAYALCDACDNIRLIGELNTWFKVSMEEVLQMAEYIKEHNWDLKISYKDVLYPT
ncbi:uncharacterized protein [Halyomorpha halys]|uniref:uncharacterized protein isoform X2 n=1 Tax=Halyomorpha halys TaxID=286706 RepID=UPI0006D4DA3C|nr:uncharacterized protein LOC106677121 isoform X2 [Halyomorpha halys]